LREGDEDEGALVKARMRDFQGGLIQNQVTIKDDIEIEGTGAVGDGGRTVAAEVMLDFEQVAEEFERRERGFERDDGIEEARLTGEADGSSGVERGAGSDAAEGGEATEGDGKCGVGRAGGARQVGA
jgi:hypothetical protein